MFIRFMLVNVLALGLSLPLLDSQAQAREAAQPTDHSTAASTDPAPATQPADSSTTTQGAPQRKSPTLTPSTNDKTASAINSSTTTPATQPASTTAPAVKAPPKQVPRVAWIEIADALREGPLPYAWVTEDELGPSLSKLTADIRLVAQKPEYLGLVLYLDQPMLSYTQISEIRQALAEVRQAGKTTIAFSQAYDLKSYLLAAACDQIVLQKGGQMEFSGLAMEEMYFAGLLEKLGIKADAIQIGDFKGAEEAFTRTGPSDAWNANIEALLSDLYSQIIEHIAAGRGMQPRALEQIFAESWGMKDTDFLDRQVVDALADRDLIEVTELHFGEDFEWDQMESATLKPIVADNPFNLFRMMFQTPVSQANQPALALVHAYGPIVSGDGSTTPGSFGLDGPSIGSRTMVEVLGDCADDDNIRGVILRIDSPGGSALASEVIWQAIRELAQIKPVYVSIAGMAASGGYYLACAGDEIYVEDASILGSIGVVGGKLTMGGLYEKIGVAIHRRSRGPTGDMFNSVEPFTDAQRNSLRQAFVRTYQQFLDRVKTGRGKRIADLDAVAQGRLFTGRQCVTNGLADQVGSLHDTQLALAQEVGLQPGEYDIVHYPQPMSLQEFLKEILGGGVRAPALQSPQLTPPQALLLTARQILGDPAWLRTRDALRGMLLLQHESVLTLMPHVLVIR